MVRDLHMGCCSPCFLGVEIPREGGSRYQPMSDYVSGTDFLNSFEAGWETKGFLKVPLPSKLIPRDEVAGTQVEKIKRK